MLTDSYVFHALQLNAIKRLIVEKYSVHQVLSFFSAKSILLYQRVYNFIYPLFKETWIETNKVFFKNISRKWQYCLKDKMCEFEKNT